MKVCSFIVKFNQKLANAVYAVLYENNTEIGTFEVSWPSDKCKTYREMIKIFCQYLTTEASYSILVTENLLPDVSKMLLQMCNISKQLRVRLICDIKTVISAKYDQDYIIYNVHNEVKVLNDFESDFLIPRQIAWCYMHLFKLVA